MELNARFSDRLKNIFRTDVVDNSISHLLDDLSLDSNNVFSRSLIIDIKSDEMEIPIIARNYYEGIIEHNINSPDAYEVEKVVLPLYANTPNVIRRTFDSIIMQMFNTGFGSRLQKITTCKGEVYYGGKGIILEEDYTPLLLCTLTARKVHDNGKDYITYNRPICHINPKVFTDPNKLVNKGIIKKIIPFFSNTKVYFPYDTCFVVDSERRKVKVIVDNFDNFFIKPVKPTPSTCSNDVLNQCIVDNIDDIIALL